MPTLLKSNYWTIIDEHQENHDTGRLVTTTYEHELPHGKLIRTVTMHRDHLAEAIVFAPTAPMLPAS